jgi:hypothetical protein
MVNLSVCEASLTLGPVVYTIDNNPPGPHFIPASIILSPLFLSISPAATPSEVFPFMPDPIQTPGQALVGQPAPPPDQPQPMQGQPQQQQPPQQQQQPAPQPNPQQAVAARHHATIFRALLLGALLGGAMGSEELLAVPCGGFLAQS